LTRQVIYDGRTTLRDMEKVQKKKKARRAAQSNPLHSLCRTCVVCKRQFRGHGSMLAHIMSAPKCNDLLAPEVKAALFDHKEDRHDKSIKARLRKKGVYNLESDSDDEVKMNKTALKKSASALNDPYKMKEEKDLKKSDEQ
jgi:hypothetical protein